MFNYSYNTQVIVTMYVKTQYPSFCEKEYRIV